MIYQNNTIVEYKWVWDNKEKFTKLEPYNEQPVFNKDVYHYENIIISVEFLTEEKWKILKSKELKTLKELNVKPNTYISVLIEKSTNNILTYKQDNQIVKKVNEYFHDRLRKSRKSKLNKIDINN